VLIVGVLAAVGVPMYLGYVRDARMAEGKALAGAALTASQACAQIDPTGATCTLANLAHRIGVSSAGATGDGRWTVAITPVTLNTATLRFGGGPVTVGGATGTNVANPERRGLHQCDHGRRDDPLQHDVGHGSRDRPTLRLMLCPRCNRCSVRHCSRS
jgi:hypothetical protein